MNANKNGNVIFVKESDIATTERKTAKIAEIKASPLAKIGVHRSSTFENGCNLLEAITNNLDNVFVLNASAAY